MKKISQIILKIFIIILLMQYINTPISNASVWGEILDSSNDFLEEGKKESATIVNFDDQDIRNQVNNIYTILFSLGVALTVVYGAFLGIKFMVGSIEEQAKIKESLIPYVIACIVIFGAFGIWKIIISLMSNILN